MKDNRSVDPTLARQHLGQLLDDELANLEQLDRLLATEHALLESGRLEDISAAGETRQQCIVALHRLDDERRSLCRQHGYAVDTAGLKQLLGWCDPSGTLASRWSLCRDRADQCRQQNERNGALVTARLKRIEGLLGVLTGQQGSGGTYSALGNVNRSPASHSLARA